ncbi:hypothetical protein HS962_01615 [Pantoea sp. BIGb0393]|jgi:hypothetical protein|uniref:Uncharacterized protein n=2 Tax=Pantoea TaxID=53335 RepID=A0ABU8PN14_9GAMM|nr:MULTISPECIES: hypothetical protein [Pantoea]EJL84666.1 hypothetical protein PMI17_03855 [Pantoea sp. GM01]KNC08354.1 hypothetical protein AC790_17365 [Pantoea sp. RIT-PI-b]MBA0034941.1 hypothetical protein [Pantoea nemavictus]MBY4951516.1 hypothetical protein [Pantoea sp. DY-17]MDR6350018.1 hypothetical protein [Pantoea sp. SORGH_AS_0659]
MESSLVTSVGALLLGGGAAAVFWKPLMAGIAAIVTSNRAGGEIITSYKEQVMLLKEGHALMRQENDELRIRHDKNLRRISSLETDLRLIKNALSILLATTEAEHSDKFRSQVNQLITTLEESRDDADKQ